MADLAAILKMTVEVAIFAALIYLVLRFLRQTRGSNVLRGLLFLGVAGLITFLVLIRLMGLDRLSLLFETIAQSVVIALVIVFHPEIRRAIVHLGDSKVFARLFHKETKIVQRVSRAVENMSKVRMGALIVVERDASLQPIAESGTPLDAELTSMLLESLFYPKSALHDGAVIVRDDRIVAAACLLPLSQNPDVDKRLGTRHRAALGLAEETDALAIVVSEETGRISTTLGGKLSYDLTKDQLERQMEEALSAKKRREREARQQRRGKDVLRSLAEDPWRKLMAAALALGLWFMLDQQITESHDVEMRLGVIGIGEQLPQQIGLDELLVNVPTDKVAPAGFVNLNTFEDTPKVSLTFKGPKTSIESLKGDTLKLSVKLPNVEWDKVDSADFTVADIQLTHRALQDGKVLVSMNPPRARIKIVRVKTTTLQLTPDLVELAFGGDERLRARLRDDTFDFMPKTVELFGPARAHEELAARKSERPLRAQVTAPASARQLTAPVVLQPAFAELGLRLRERCQVTVQLRPEMQTYSFALPVLVDDLSLPAGLRGQYRPEAAAKTVRIKAGGALLSKLVGFEEGPRAGWARDNLRLVVWIQPREDDSLYPQKLTAVARLYQVGATRDADSAADYGLDELVTVELQREP